MDDAGLTQNFRRLKMKNKEILTEAELRKFVKNLLEDKSLGEEMIKINPVVDPSAAITDPSNANFKPQTKQELQVALTGMIDQLSGDNIPDVYSTLKSALKMQDEDEGKEQMQKSNKKLPTGKDEKSSKVEETIKKYVGKILKEHFEKDPVTGQLVWKGSGPAPKLALDIVKKDIPAGVSSAQTGPDTAAAKDLRKRLTKLTSADLDAAPDADAPAPGRTRRNKMREGDKLKVLAAELGFKNPNGALQFSDKALQRFGYNWENYDAIVVASLEVMKEYVQELAAATDMAPADVQLMLDHPEHVADLDTFRVFLRKKLRQRGMMP